MPGIAAIRNSWFISLLHNGTSFPFLQNRVSKTIQTISVMLSFCKKATKKINFSFKLLLCGVNCYFIYLFICLWWITEDCIYVVKIQKRAFFLCLGFTPIHRDINTVSLLTSARGITSSVVAISHISALNDSLLQRKRLWFFFLLYYPTGI